MKSKKELDDTPAQENPTDETGKETAEKQENVQSKKTSTKQKSKADDTPAQENPTDETGKETVEKPIVSDEVIAKAKRLNPQYKKFYLNSRGFVYPVGTPKKQMMGEVVLVDNEMFQN